MKDFGVRCAVAAILASILISGFSTKAVAQICAGSSLRYVVRDAKGVVIDPVRAYQPENSGQIEELKEAGKGIKGAATESVKVIKWRAMCNFREPVKATLNLNGKEMMLEFRMPKFQQYESRSFLVDSIPFRQGRYLIDLSAAGEENAAGAWLGQFYPAKSWTRMGSPKQ